MRNTQKINPIWAPIQEHNGSVVSKPKERKMGKQKKFERIIIRVIKDKKDNIHKKKKLGNQCTI